MKNRIINLFITIVTIVGLTVVSVPAFAACTDPCNCQEIPEEVRIASGCEPGKAGDTSDKVIINIINGILGFISIAAVAVILIAGIRIMTSAGDTGKVKKGKDAILYASIGLVIAALAAVIVNFVITTITQ